MYVQNARLRGLSVMSMSARTLILTGVDFPEGSRVLLRSELGVLAPQPNTGLAPMPGHVNFYTDVTYGGQPAQDRIADGSIRISRR